MKLIEIEELYEVTLSLSRREAHLLGAVIARMSQNRVTDMLNENLLFFEPVNDAANEADKVIVDLYSVLVDAERQCYQKDQDK